MGYMADLCNHQLILTTLVKSEAWEPGWTTHEIAQIPLFHCYNVIYTKSVVINDFKQFNYTALERKTMVFSHSCTTFKVSHIAHKHA